MIPFPSFPRKRESSLFLKAEGSWTPALAGVTMYFAVKDFLQ
jgi:hypothetical protein